MITVAVGARIFPSFQWVPLSPFHYTVYIILTFAKVLWENIISVSLRRNPWNKALSKPFRITETSNRSRRGHLCRFHKNLSIVLLARWHSERWKLCTLKHKKYTYQKRQRFHLHLLLQQANVISPVSLCVRLKFLFLEHFQPAISTVYGSLFFVSG